MVRRRRPIGGSDMFDDTGEQSFTYGFLTEQPTDRVLDAFKEMNDSASGVIETYRVTTLAMLDMWAELADLHIQKPGEAWLPKPFGQMYDQLTRAFWVHML